jgi:predicted transcriptional regulator
VRVLLSNTSATMPIQMVRVFLLSALHEHENIGTQEMATRAGLPLSVASRHLIDLSEFRTGRPEKDEEGLQPVMQ